MGRLGAAVDTLEDMEGVFVGVPLDAVSVSFTINATAPILFAMWLAAAERQGVAPGALRGTFQNDILKEYIGRARGSFRRGPRCASRRISSSTARRTAPG